MDGVILNCKSSDAFNGSSQRLISDFRHHVSCMISCSVHISAFGRLFIQVGMCIRCNYMLLIKRTNKDIQYVLCLDVLRSREGH